MVKVTVRVRATKFKLCEQMQCGRFLPADQKLYRNAAGDTEYNSL